MASGAKSGAPTGSPARVNGLAYRASPSCIRGVNLGRARSLSDIAFHRGPFSSDRWRRRIPARREDVPQPNGVSSSARSQHVLRFGNNPAAAGRGRDPSRAMRLSFRNNPSARDRKSIQARLDSSRAVSALARLRPERRDRQTLPAIRSGTQLPPETARRQGFLGPGQ